MKNTVKAIFAALFAMMLMVTVMPQKAMAASYNFTVTIYGRYYDAAGNLKGEVPFTSQKASFTITSYGTSALPWAFAPDGSNDKKYTATTTYKYSYFAAISLPQPSDLWSYDSDKYTFLGGVWNSTRIPISGEDPLASAWNETQSGHSNTARASATNTSQTFYYIFQEKAQEVTYTLNYDTKGGTPTIDADTKTSSTGSATFTISSTVPGKEGYNFMGWSTTDGGSVEFNPGSSFTTSAQNNTLYAIWERIVLPGKLVVACENLQNGESAVFEVRNSNSETLYTVSVSSESPSVTITGVRVGTYSVVPMEWTWTYGTMQSTTATVLEAQTATASFTAVKKSNITEKYGEEHAEF